MLTISRPLPTTPYVGPILAPRRPLPRTPLPLANSTISSGTPSTGFQRRPHIRRLQSSPPPELFPVREEEEVEDTHEEFIAAPKPKRPRPTPLIPPRSYVPSPLPLVIENPDDVSFFDRPITGDEYESFALSPSKLLARRRSETILDFPVPPSHALPIPKPSSPPAMPTNSSPTPSNISLASTSSTSSASSTPYPLTPHSSEVDEADMPPLPKKIEGDVCTEELPPRSPHRSASVISLRSFNTAEFDARAESIYALLHPRNRAPDQRPPVPPIQTRAPPAAEPSIKSSSHRVLSVIDTAGGDTMNVPLVLRSFLSLSPSTSEPPSPAADSDCEGIPIFFSDAEGDDFGLGLASSEDDASDDESGPSRCFDPTFRAKLSRRRLSRNGDKSPVLPPVPALEPLELGPDTPSVYSMASPDWTRERPPPRGSLVPSDVSHESYIHPNFSLPRPPSPFHHSSRSDSPSPALRSRFSSSTLDSLLPLPAPSTQTFIGRLTSRVKPSSPSKSERSPVLRSSMRRRQFIPPSPAPSAFSFSSRSSSRSSLDSAERSSVFSEDSASSSGLRRPPIPIELFLRG